MCREKIVDKSELTGRDYLLFQNTLDWELAKAVEDRNTEKIDKIVSEKSGVNQLSGIKIRRYAFNADNYGSVAETI